MKLHFEKYFYETYIKFHAAMCVSYIEGVFTLIILLGFLMNTIYDNMDTLLDNVKFAILVLTFVWTMCILIFKDYFRGLFLHYKYASHYNKIIRDWYDE